MRQIEDSDVEILWDIAINILPKKKLDRLHHSLEQMENADESSKAKLRMLLEEMIDYITYGN